MRALLALCLMAGTAAAHDGVVHKSAEEALRHRAEAVLPALGAPTALPFDIGGSFGGGCGIDRWSENTIGAITPVV